MKSCDVMCVGGLMLALIGNMYMYMYIHLCCTWSKGL